MDRKTWLTVALCFLIFLGWQKIYVEPRLTKSQPVPSSQVLQTTPQTVQGTLQQGSPNLKAEGSAQVEARKTIPEQRVKLAASSGELEVTNGGRFFAQWSLKNFTTQLGKDAPAVDLGGVTHQTQGQGEFAFDLADLAYVSGVQGTLTEIPGGVRWDYEDQNIKVSRTFLSSASQNYVDLTLNAQFKTVQPKYAFVSIANQGLKDDREARDRKLVYWTNNSMESVSVSDSVELLDVPSAVKWVGVTNRYFLMSLNVPEGQVQPKGLIQPAGEYAGRISLVYPVNGNAISIPLKVYFGAKELDAIRAVDTTLDHTVDFGIFTVFAYPLLRLLKLFYKIFQNYGVAIVLLTVLVRIVVYPLTFKSMKSMKQMAAIQPQLQKIREKYKDDKEALNREMMNLMRTQGYNPMSGCLPIFVQMPVFFALYNVLYNAIELYHAPFAFWIQDLSSKDPYYVTPVLLSLTMYVQQKLQPSTATDPAQQKMMQFMPILFGGFMLGLPSGLTLYMLVSAVAGILQQLMINKKLGMPRVAVVAGR